MVTGDYRSRNLNYLGGNLSEKLSEKALDFYQHRFDLYRELYEESYRGFEEKEFFSILGKAHRDAIEDTKDLFEDLLE